MGVLKNRVRDDQCLIALEQQWIHKRDGGPNGCRVVLSQVLFNALDVGTWNSRHAVVPAIVAQGECFDLIFLSDSDDDQSPSYQNRSEHGGAGQPRHLHRRRKQRSSIRPVNTNRESAKEIAWHAHWHGQCTGQKSAAVTRACQNPFPVGNLPNRHGGLARFLRVILKGRGYKHAQTATT